MEEQAICYHLSVMQLHLNEIKRGSWKVPYHDLPAYIELYHKVSELDKLLRETSLDFVSEIKKGETNE